VTHLTNLSKFFSVTPISPTPQLRMMNWLRTLRESLRPKKAINVMHHSSHHQVATDNNLLLWILTCREEELVQALVLVPALAQDPVLCLTISLEVLPIAWVAQVPEVLAVPPTPVLLMLALLEDLHVALLCLVDQVALLVDLPVVLLVALPVACHQAARRETLLLKATYSATP